MGLFENRKMNGGKTQVPVWYMRQAGRYHSHYQNLKKKHSFMELCKDPQLACDVTMGPIEDFNFDAAIMFSDLLFPLEHLGMGLNYKQGPPRLGYHLQSLDDLKNIDQISNAHDFYQFQGEAAKKLKETLPKEKDLLGFVGAPFTLYTYAVEGSHAGNLVSAKKGLIDGRWKGFLERLLPSLKAEILVQAQAGIDGICFFDTAVGELCLEDFEKYIIPVLKELSSFTKEKFPKIKIIYYSKHTNLEYLERLEDDNIDVLGIDWRVNIVSALKKFSKDYYIQGNIDPGWLHLPNGELMRNLQAYKGKVLNGGVDLSKWIAGLGHGVLIETPEQNVRDSVRFFQENFLY